MGFSTQGSLSFGAVNLAQQRESRLRHLKTFVFGRMGTTRGGEQSNEFCERLRVLH